jgi:hypothetical protein
MIFAADTGKNRFLITVLHHSNDGPFYIWVLMATANLTQRNNNINSTSIILVQTNI